MKNEELRMKNEELRMKNEELRMKRFKLLVPIKIQGIGFMVAEKYNSFNRLSIY
jgi:hypothetical protein